MIFETYICSKSNQMIEFGLTFKASNEVEDSLFDVVLGEAKPTSLDIEKKLVEGSWVGRAICMAMAEANSESPLTAEGQSLVSAPYQRELAGGVLEYGIDFNHKADNSPAFRAVLGEQVNFDSDAMERDYRQYGWIALAVVKNQG